MADKFSLAVIEARLAGYTWPEINGYIEARTAKAMAPVAKQQSIASIFTEPGPEPVRPNQKPLWEIIGGR